MYIAFCKGYNAVMRAIDLGTNILAPTTVGFLMSWLSPVAAATFLCMWNVFSMVVEYILLMDIYKTFPALASKYGPTAEDQLLGVRADQSVLPADASSDPRSCAGVPRCSGA